MCTRFRAAPGHAKRAVGTRVTSAFRQVKPVLRVGGPDPGGRSARVPECQPTRAYRAADLHLPALVPKARSAGLPMHACLSVSGDRKSTRLNSSHMSISYAVFCWK